MSTGGLLYDLHCDDLQKYYDSIVNSLISASNIGVPQIRLGVEKHWWTPSLVT